MDAIPPIPPIGSGIRPVSPSLGTRRVSPDQRGRGQPERSAERDEEELERDDPDREPDDDSDDDELGRGERPREAGPASARPIGDPPSASGGHPHIDIRA